MDFHVSSNLHCLSRTSCFTCSLPTGVTRPWCWWWFSNGHWATQGKSGTISPLDSSVPHELTTQTEGNHGTTSGLGPLREEDSHQKGDDDFGTGNSQELSTGTRDCFNTNSSKPAGDAVRAASINPNATQGRSGTISPLDSSIPHESTTRTEGNHGTTSGLGPLREESSKSTRSNSQSLMPASVNKSPWWSLSQRTSPISSNSRMPMPSLDIQNSPQSLKRASEKRAYVPWTKRQIGDLTQRNQNPKRLKLAELFPLRNLVGLMLLKHSIFQILTMFL